jgi:hypothetical protein
MLCWARVRSNSNKRIGVFLFGCGIRCFLCITRDQHATLTLLVPCSCQQGAEPDSIGQMVLMDGLLFLSLADLLYTV